MNPFQHTHRICFELSNTCNYAACHRKCPVNQYATLRTLKTEIVEAVIEYAYQQEFTGWVSFHVYNEPMIDPRLIEFVSHASMLAMKPFIMTNGWYLDQNILTDLRAAGVHKLHVTTYSEPEFDRIRNLNFGDEIEHRVNWTKVLDDRLKIYDGPEIRENLTKPCSQPLGELMIRHTGQVGLCCNDWQMRHTFGDLNVQSIEEVLSMPRLEEIMWDLEKRFRKLEICKRCKGGRMKPPETKGKE